MSYCAQVQDNMLTIFLFLSEADTQPVPVLRKGNNNTALAPSQPLAHGVTGALRATGQQMAASGQRAKGCCVLLKPARAVGWSRRQATVVGPDALFCCFGTRTCLGTRWMGLLLLVVRLRSRRRSCSINQPGRDEYGRTGIQSLLYCTCTCHRTSATGAVAGTVHLPWMVIARQLVW